MNPADYTVTRGRCNVCGADTRQDRGRCTNGRCGACHGEVCTPGGQVAPGHGFGSALAIARRRRAIVRLARSRLAAG